MQLLAFSHDFSHVLGLGKLCSGSDTASVLPPELAGALVGTDGYTAIEIAQTFFALLIFITSIAALVLWWRRAQPRRIILALAVQALLLSAMLAVGYFFTQSGFDPDGPNYSTAFVHRVRLMFPVIIIALIATAASALLTFVAKNRVSQGLTIAISQSLAILASLMWGEIFYVFMIC